MLQCVALLRERAAGVLRDVQARALWSRGSDAPRPAGVRRRLAIERPLTVPPKGLSSVRRPRIAGFALSRAWIKAGAAEDTPCVQVRFIAVRARPGSPSGELSSPRTIHLRRGCWTGWAPWTGCWGGCWAARLRLEGRQWPFLSSDARHLDHLENRGTGPEF